MAPSNFETTTCTVRGHKFVIEMHDGRKRIRFVDPSRGYLCVAEMRVSVATADNYKQLEASIRRGAFDILREYAMQYGAKTRDIAFTEAIKLTAAEVADGVGKPPTALLKQHGMALVENKGTRAPKKKY